MTQQRTSPTATIRPLKERQRAEREGYILEAAEAVMAERGYHDASMDEIAARVGVAKGTLYLHFPSKDDLVVALFARELGEFREFLERTAAEPISARARLERIVRWMLNARHGQRLQLLFSIASSLSMHWGVFETRLAMPQHIEYCAAVLREILEAGQESGEIDRTLPTHAMVVIFFGLLAPHRFARPQTSCMDDTEAMVDATLRILFHGIAAPRP